MQEKWQRSDLISFDIKTMVRINAITPTSWFDTSQDFEAMKTGKLAIWPWLTCPHNKNTLADLPCSVDLP